MTRIPGVGGYVMRALRAPLLVLSALLWLTPSAGLARGSRGSVRVEAHTIHTKRGVRRVVAHHRTRPNARRNDNYGTQGKTNPYTAKKGTRKRSPKG